MKTLRIIIAFLSLITIASSCTKEIGKGAIVTEIRKVESFTQIELNNSANVEIIKGDTLLVEISDYENIIKYLSVTVENGTLVITTKPDNTILENSKAKVTITIPDVLTNLEISGSGNITMANMFSKLQSFQISGGGDIFAKNSNTNSLLSLEISGSGNITVNGTGNRIDAEISGSGNIDCSEYLTQTAQVEINGSGNIITNAQLGISGVINGSGNIEYIGLPKVDIEVNGSGNIYSQK